MFRQCIIAAAFIISLAASAFAQNSFLLKLQVDGKQRAALVRVPTVVAENSPVVFYSHGGTDSGGWFQKMGGTDATADREKYICIYACAEANCRSGVWPDMYGTSDFPYYFALLDSVDNRYQVDRNRVYFAGFSQGAFHSFTAACNYSDIFAAVAPVSGYLSPNVNCNIKRPVPIYLTWGTTEPTPKFLEARDLWVKLNKCPTTGTITKPYPSSSSSTKRVRVVYAPCEGNTQVVFDTIMGHTHRWPAQSNGNQADEIWNFLKQYSLNKSTNARPRASAKSRGPISVTYVSGMIRLGGLREEAKVEVTDTKGKRISTATTRQHQFAFTGESRGVYLVKVRGAGIRAAQKIMIP
ncbi:MAG: PHB depolymerase family esterase [Fibrobacteria bacterium]